jgi:hypothetical protein
MSTRLRRSLLISGALVLAAALCAAYLFTWGHVFLPRWRLEGHESEQIETRTYDFFAIPRTSRTAYIAWQIKHPGQARLVATAEALGRSAINSSNPLRDCLQSMGYTFPSGCDASGGRGDPPRRWAITHHVSMLNRIEKDLSLTLHSRTPAHAEPEAAPNPQGGANGRQPFSSDTVQTSAAAASRRSP